MATNRLKVPEEEFSISDILEGIQKNWRLIIISAICTLACYHVISLVKSNYYEGLVKISKAKSSTFDKFIPFNDILKINKIEYKVTEESILTKFIEELSDYNQRESIIEKYMDSKKEQFVASSRTLARNISISKVKDLENIDHLYLMKYKLQLEDSKQVRALLDQIIYETISKTKARIIQEVDAIIDVNEKRIQVQKDQQKAALKSIKESLHLEIEKRILYLQEQQDIAEKLDIDSSSIRDLIKNKEGVKGILLTPDKLPYYLHGYKAIKLEKEGIRERNINEQISMNNEAINIKKALIALDNNTHTKELALLKTQIRNDDTMKWITNNLRNHVINSNKKPILHSILSIILGLIIGIFYSIVRHISDTGEAKLTIEKFRSREDEYKHIQRSQA